MVSINRILCPIDFSDFSRDALRHGLALAQWYSAHLTPFHVYQVSQPLPVEGLPGSVPVYVDVDPNKMAEEVRRFCDPLVGPSGRTAEVIVRPGDAARETRKEAERVPSDLLILGTHGRSGFERLCAIDLTKASRHAFDRALSIARASKARLYIRHVVPASFPFLWHQDERLKLLTSLRERAEREDVPVRTVEQHGDPAGTIVLHGNARRADLVVIGSNRRRGWRRCREGSVGERVLREAASLLIVPGDVPSRRRRPSISGTRSASAHRAPATRPRSDRA